jgi:hypothetical protein
MNAVEIANNLIFRAKNINEFVVEVDLEEPVRFNGVVPFDLTINNLHLTAKVYALDFCEAVTIVNDYLESLE